MNKRSNDEYKKFAGEVLSNVPEDDREAIAGVLNSQKAKEAYGIMHDSQIPKTTMRRIMLHGIKDIARDKHISAGAYATAIAEQLVKYDQYDEVVDDMHNEGVLSDHQYNSVKHEIKLNVKQKTGAFKSGLENLARAAVYFLLLLGVILMLLSASGITGAVIGDAAPQASHFIVGFVIFAIGLFLFHKTK